MELLVVVSIATLLCLWYTFSLWYLGVIPFLRGRPKLYDLMEDQVRILFRDSTNISIHFSEIEALRFFDPRKNATRPFRYKMIDPMSRLSHYGNMTFGRWFKDVLLNVLPPYSFGFGSKQGEIHIQLNSGSRGLRVLFPWFNTPLRSRDMSLLPFAPKEFYQQLEIAFEKWRQAQSKSAVKTPPQRRGVSARIPS